MGLDVIYGDTDSIMINTKRLEIDDAMEIAKKVNGHPTHIHLPTHPLSHTKHTLSIPSSTVNFFYIV